LRDLLPDAKLGQIESIERLTAGLSGAAVYGVTTTRGSFVLRVQSRRPDDDYFAQQLRILQRVSAAGIAPELVHSDASALATVSRRVVGTPLARALAEPAQRIAVLTNVVDRLRVLHGLDTAGVSARDPIPFARAAYEAVRHRAGFPPWAAALEPSIEEFSRVLERDPRRVISHNDVNPGNLLWDGARAWLVDWEVAGLGHPHYDLATLAVFLRLDDDTAFELAAWHDGAPLDDVGRERMQALRRLVGVLAGLTFLGLVDDLNVRPCPTKRDAPTLSDCYAALRSGQLSMQTPYGAASMGLALLALGMS